MRTELLPPSAFGTFLRIVWMIVFGLFQLAFALTIGVVLACLGFLGSGSTASPACPLPHREDLPRW